MIKALNNYLKDNGIEVVGNTDKYYRLSPDGIKAWHVDEVTQPDDDTLQPYIDAANQDEIQEEKLRQIEQLKQKAREAVIDKLIETDNSPEAVKYRQARAK